MANPRKAFSLKAVSGPEIPTVASDIQSPAGAVSPSTIKASVTRNNNEVFIRLRDSDERYYTYSLFRARQEAIGRPTVSLLGNDRPGTFVSRSPYFGRETHRLRRHSSHDFSERAGLFGRWQGW